MADGTQSKCRAVCLISGSGTNLQAIIENINKKSPKVLIWIIESTISIVGLNKKSKRKIVRGRIGIKSGFKKAVVTLKKGQTIDLATGV